MGGKVDSAPRSSEPAVTLLFYEEIEPLVVELGRAMSVALDQGHAAVCAVTDATRQALEDQVVRRGIDIDGARRCGRYLHLDCHATLSRITRDGNPDARLFSEVVGRPIEQLAKEHRCVWMYSELAPLMWSLGNERGAMALNKLWAAFADTQPVLLYVAFPVEAMSWPVVRQELQQTVADQVRALANGSAIALAILHGPQQVNNTP